MTKERSAAVTTVLVLVALGWGLVRRQEATRAELRDNANHRNEMAMVPEDDWLPPQPVEDVEVQFPPLITIDPRPSMLLADAKTQASDRSVPADVPGKMPRPNNIAPLFPNAADAKRLRAMIRAELPNATPDQVRIWEKKLSGMPLHMAQELLDFRRRFPVRESKTAPVPPGDPFAEPQPIQSHASPGQPRPLPEPLKSSFDALHQARRVIMNNIANARTPGYRRSFVVLKEQPGGGVIVDRIERSETPGVELKRELAELAVIAEHMKAIQTAAAMFEGIDDPRPAPPRLAKPITIKPTAARKPRHKVEVRLNLDAKQFLHGVSWPRVLQGLRVIRKRGGE